MSPQTLPTDAPHEDAWLDQPPGPWLVRWVRWSGWGAWGAAILALAVFLGLSPFSG